MSADEFHTVSDLQRDLGKRHICWEEDLDQSDLRNVSFVFRSPPDGGCESYSLERREIVGLRQFDSEAAAVRAAWAQVYAVDDEPTAPRRPATTSPRTVEELKDALAEVGQDPDQLTRAEVLRESPKTDPLVVLTRHGDGSVETYLLERGRDRDHTTYADEAEAVAALSAVLLLRHLDEEVTDLRVERMRVHARQHRARLAALAAHAPRPPLGSTS